MTSEPACFLQIYYMNRSGILLVLFRVWFFSPLLSRAVLQGSSVASLSSVVELGAEEESMESVRPVRKMKKLLVRKNWPFNRARTRLLVTKIWISGLWDSRIRSSAISSADVHTNSVLQGITATTIAIHNVGRFVVILFLWAGFVWNWNKVREYSTLIFPELCKGIVYLNWELFTKLSPIKVGLFFSHWHHCKKTCCFRRESWICKKLYECVWLVNDWNLATLFFWNAVWSWLLPAYELHVSF